MTAFWLFVAAGVGTLAIRMSGIAWLGRGRELSPGVSRTLQMVAPAALAAIVANSLLLDHGSIRAFGIWHVAAGIAALAVFLKRDTNVILGVGIAAFAVLLLVTGCAPPGATVAGPRLEPTSTDSSTAMPSVAPAEFPLPPAPGAPWQLVLDGSSPADPTAAAYDLDGDAAPSQLAELRAANPDVYLICYISVGSWEEWRGDAADFPEDVLGGPLEDWPGERYVDVRARDALAPIWEARLDACAAAGFDAVDPDNIDVYANDSGFALTAADAEAMMRWLAEAAHERGLAIGQKNAPELVPALADVVDFAVVEECLEQSFCARFDAFGDAGKPVFAVEYPASATIPTGYCERAEAHGLSLLLSTPALNGPGWRCA